MKLLLTQFLLLALITSSTSLVNLSDTECGVLRKTRLGKIVGGGNAEPGQFPWLVSLTRRGGHFCGGTILNNRWIVTAGHCLCSGTDDIIQAQHIKVQIGQYDLRQTSNTKSYEMSIAEIILHPGYHCNRVSNDIAMMHLSTSLEWSPLARPACLPFSKSDTEYNRFEGSEATVAGWGWLNENNQDGGRADILQMVSVEVIKNNVCNDWYRSQGKKTQIHDSQMCAGDEQGGKDSCWADSGGPLMVTSKGKALVIGVVSTGIGCARPRLPGLYTRISEYIPWIQEILNSN